MKNYYNTFLLLFSFLFLNVSGQKLNSYKFIEPNISVSYDSNYFKISQFYSNSFYETEGYDFKYQKDLRNKITIHIKADNPERSTSSNLVDSQMYSGLNSLKNLNSDSFKIMSINESPRHIQGFSLAGFVLYDKISKQYSTLIRGFHLSDNDKTEINYTSFYRNDIEKEYEILKTFLQNFKSYSKDRIAVEEKQIKNRYSIDVNPTKKNIDKFKHRQKTYLGIVSVKQPLQHQIAEVRLTISSGQEIFSSDNNKQIPIICLDEKKGNIVKTGELILFNSFGKKVKLPFTFSYVNKGIW